MSTASSSPNMLDTSAPGLRAGDKISVFSLPDTNGSPVSSTVLLERGPLILTFYRGIWCPYCRGDLMALVDATAEVQSCGGSLAAVGRARALSSEDIAPQGNSSGSLGLTFQKDSCSFVFRLFLKDQGRELGQDRVACAQRSVHLILLLLVSALNSINCKRRKANRL